MSKNKLIIAAAGSGKTTYLVDEALKISDQNVLITTYTEANEAEIKKKIIQRKGGYIPKNITVQTWFSFLLQHGVRPYQSFMKGELQEQRIGFFLAEGSTTTYKGSDGRTYSYSKEKDFYNYYFLTKNNLKICSDTIADFIVECNQESKGEVLSRISKIYPNIFIDEVQDLAGWELVLLKLLFDASSNICMVGDPRQVVYLTHHSKKYSKYDGNIREFIQQECKKDICEINSETLKRSHRNNQAICSYSSKLFPQNEICEPCTCEQCRNYTIDHEGIFLVKKQHVNEYSQKFSPTILRWSESTYPEWNFGKSKGLTFDRVLIYPTTPIKEWIKNNSSDLETTSRCKFYVAITRARYSVAIVYDYKDTEDFPGIEKYCPLPKLSGSLKVNPIIN